MSHCSPGFACGSGGPGRVPMRTRVQQPLLCPGMWFLPLGQASASFTCPRGRQRGWRRPEGVDASPHPGLWTLKRFLGGPRGPRLGFAPNSPPRGLPHTCPVIRAGVAVRGPLAGARRGKTRACGAGHQPRPGSCLGGCRAGGGRRPDDSAPRVTRRGRGSRWGCRIRKFPQSPPGAGQT